MDSNKTFDMTDSRILLHGRAIPAQQKHESSSAALFWTGSGIEFRTDSSEAYVLFRSDYSVCEQWISVEIDGAQVMRCPVPRGASRIPVMLCRQYGIISDVRVFRDVQPIGEDKASFLTVEGIELDGRLLEPPARKHRIEFIGDSITSGEGIIGPDGAPDWIPMWFSGSLGYPNLTAKAVGADFRVVSQSGWGLVNGYDNNPEHAVPLVYDQVCGVLNSDAQKALGSTEPNDFSLWQPDFIVVNLGTNDYGSMFSDAYFDPDGTMHKLRDIPEHHRLFSSKAEEFLAHIRELNPDAHIIWLFGMFPTMLYQAVTGALERRRAAGDSALSLLNIDPVTPDELGSRRHPGPPAHRRAASSLIAEINRILA